MHMTKAGNLLLGPCWRGHTLCSCIVVNPPNKGSPYSAIPLEWTRLNRKMWFVRCRDENSIENEVCLQNRLHWLEEYLQNEATNLTVQLWTAKILWLF